MKIQQSCWVREMILPCNQQISLPQTENAAKKSLELITDADLLDHAEVLKLQGLGAGYRSTNRTCYRCGFKHNPDQCPFKDKQCFFLQKCVGKRKLREMEKATRRTMLIIKMQPCMRLRKHLDIFGCHKNCHTGQSL